jgi:hypothetical protein
MPSDTPPPQHPRGANETILVVTAVVSLVVTVVVALFGDGLLTSGRQSDEPSPSGGSSWVGEHLWLSFVILFALIMVSSWVVALNNDADAAWGIGALAGAALAVTLVLWSMVDLSFWWTTLVVLAVVAIVGLVMDSAPTAVVSGGLLGLLLVGWLVVSIPVWLSVVLGVVVVVVLFFTLA